MGQRGRPGPRERREYKNYTGGKSYADVRIEYGKEVADAAREKMIKNPRLTGLNAKRVSGVRAF